MENYKKAVAEMLKTAETLKAQIETLKDKMPNNVDDSTYFAIAENTMTATSYLHYVYRFIADMNNNLTDC